VETNAIIENLPDADYRAIDAVSKSDLDKWVKGPVTRKASQRFFLLGSALHALVLEGGDAYADRYYAAETDFNLSTKVGKTHLANLSSQHPGKEILKPKEYDQLLGMYNSLMVEPEARSIIDSAKRTELSIVSSHEGFDDLASKCRLDLETGMIIGDVKSTHCMNSEDFQLSFIRFGYDIQAAYYQDLYKRATGLELPFTFLCVCSKPPYPSWVTYPTPLQIATGRRHYRLCLEFYKRYKKETDHATESTATSTATA